MASQDEAEEIALDCFSIDTFVLQDEDILGSRSGETAIHKYPNSSVPQQQQKSSRFESEASENEWSMLNLSMPILKGIYDAGYKYPTPVQYLTIPYVLEGRDVLATAQTGSGKTAAFLVPIMEKLNLTPGVSQRRKIGDIITGGSTAIKVLILLPTRELAFQCFEVFLKLSRYVCLTAIHVTGGIEAKIQEATFRQRPDIVIATPGRMLDHLLNSPSVHFELIDMVVLDEADRLIDFGFRDECLRILEYCSLGGRQTLLFSATLSEAVKDVALLSLNQPVYLNTHRSVTSTQMTYTLAQGLEHTFIRIRHPDMREAAILYLCTEVYTKDRILVFFRTKQQVHRASLIFNMFQLRHIEYHGNLTQTKRHEAFIQFHKDETIRFMLSSELAARGLDLPNVTVVINCAVPPEVSRYIHQAGRTGRKFTNGHVVTLWSIEEKANLTKALKAIRKADSSPKIIRQRLCECRDWRDRIKAIEPQIEEQLEQDKFDQQLRSAEMKLEKLENCEKYADLIKLRPKKNWIKREEKNKLSKLNHSEIKSDREKQNIARIGKGFKRQLKKKKKYMLRN